MAIEFNEVLGIELTEEQQKKLAAAVTTEVDRARTQASQTAHSNANADWEKKLPNLIADAVAKQTADATKTAEQRAQEQYQQQILDLQTNMAALVAQNTVNENKNKVRAAGISDDATVDAIASMFVQNPDGIDGFLGLYSNAVSEGVKVAQQASTNSVTPPGAGTNPVPNVSNVMSQQAISQMLQANSQNNGGMLNEDQLFADLRAAQLATS